MASDIEKVCSSCQKPAALKCGRCKFAWYCSAVCQRAHWKEHKSTCKEDSTERTIYRAGDLLQQIFYVYCEKNFDRRITKLEDLGDRLIIHYAPGISAPFVPFPKHLVSDDEQKAMMLSNFKCNDAVAYFYDLLVDLLQGIDGLEIEEWNGTLQLPKRRTQAGADGSSIQSEASIRKMREQPWHWITVLKITKSSKSIVLDISGAQFGIFKPCWDLEQYRTKYADAMNDAQVPGGTVKQNAKADALIQGWNGYVQRKGWAAVDAVQNAVQDWKLKTGLSLRALLHRPERDFIKGKAELLDSIGMSLDQFVANVDFKKDMAAAIRYEKKHPGTSQRISDERFLSIAQHAHIELQFKKMGFSGAKHMLI
ncbi:hypothetical protein BDV96DRAFT_642062 [Lophiotrema nucula]|uniref:MYND-type domain-containing protein n=1 Tax=Lophiotrema nucula TaxID=690887 RepID=A0A6A5ZN14_9PLEO|nr:hypothetical protein BDV96DRAFT_642062 [Lophiotrema nucula]